MEDGRIQDSQLTASSYWDAAVVPAKARLNHGAGIGDAWHPKVFTTNEWIQVDLGVSTSVTGLVLQGRDKDNNAHQYVTTYWVQYSDDTTSWIWVTDVDQQNAKVNVNSHPPSILYVCTSIEMVLSNYSCYGSI